jgi:lipopolysaccharide cholinephosphotransferase
MSQKRYCLTSADLTALKSLETKVLLEFKKVCDVLHTGFFLDAGTLLGAVRHGGFIPWDDDIDVCMLRPDYERFMREAPALISGDFFLQTPDNSPLMPASFMKLRLNGTKMVEDIIDEIPGNHGIWIDIFPFDVVPLDTDFGKLRKQQAFYGKLFDLRARSKQSGNLSWGKALMRHLIHGFLQLVPRDRILSHMRYPYDDPIDHGGLITCFHYGTCFFTLDYKTSLPPAHFMFEGYEMPVLRTWERYLTQVYGDWQQLPPENERMPHHYVSELDLGPYKNPS